MKLLTPAPNFALLLQSKQCLFLSAVFFKSSSPVSRQGPGALDTSVRNRRRSFASLSYRAGELRNPSIFPSSLQATFGCETYELYGRLPQCRAQHFLYLPKPYTGPCSMRLIPWSTLLYGGDDAASSDRPNHRRRPRSQSRRETGMGTARTDESFVYNHKMDTRF